MRFNYVQRLPSAPGKSQPERKRLGRWAGILLEFSPEGGFKIQSRRHDGGGKPTFAGTKPLPFGLPSRVLPPKPWIRHPRERSVRPFDPVAGRARVDWYPVLLELEFGAVGEEPFFTLIYQRPAFDF